MRFKQDFLTIRDYSSYIILYYSTITYYYMNRVLTRLEHEKYRNRGFSSDCCSRIPHHRYPLGENHGGFEGFTGDP